MDMEMADYEKLVKELNHKLCEKDKQAEEHEMQIQAQKEGEQRLKEEIGTNASRVLDVVICERVCDQSHYVLILPESLKLLLDQTEDKASKMKQLLVKTKKDLADAKQKVSLMKSVSEYTSLKMTLILEAQGNDVNSDVVLHRKRRR